MELRIHRAAGICFPHSDPSEWARAFGDWRRRASSRLADKISRYAGAVRLGTYTAAGTATGVVAAASGMETADAISLGMNVAATAAAFWPLSKKPNTGGTGAC
nr:hypothetical protein [Streptomyces sp. F11]